MANLKEIRNRIASVSSQMRITSAMKMVSAAKLKKAQESISAMRPYSEKLNQIIKNLTISSEMDNTHPLSDIRKIKRVLIVAITSNRGLCGSFNSNVIKGVIKNIEGEYSNKEVEILTLGKKGNDILGKKYKIVLSDNKIFDDFTYDHSSKISDFIIEKYISQFYDKVIIVYNQFKNAATQILNFENLLPINFSNQEQEESFDYIFEPSHQEIIYNLLPKSITIKLYRALKDSYASEHGARMTAMHKATDNATEIRDQLKLTYNQARQASITNEILEIVGGAEALKN
ncbi:MAG: ATP synthase F1 subunit gamma [Flavobacteriaceae bacterium]|nr:ATP synthase F1 subunit gamma [Flavobacteriaceae bacterium]